MDKELAGIAALLLVLIVGALFGRLHGSDGGAVKPVGDRVACGLLALPLISIAVHLAFPGAHVAWALAAPAPLAVYVVLLAGADLGWVISRKYFNAALVLGIGTIYVLMAASAWMSGI
ncbi:MAG TPA: hypothetical protein VFX02_08750 [Gammaproteobacteria bacterium]|nr:hypothetical protein [Gammaproteobacteria bacterium]